MTPEELFLSEKDYATALGRIYYRRIVGLRIPNSFTFHEDDYIQAAHIGMWEAAQDFDPGKGVLFRTYAQYNIRKKLSLQRHESYFLGAKASKSRDYKKSSVAIWILDPRDRYWSGECFATSYYRTDRERLFSDHELKRKLVESLCQSNIVLPARRELFERVWVEGLSPLEISKILGVSRQRIYQLCQDILERIKSHLDLVEEYL